MRPRSLPALALLVFASALPAVACAPSDGAGTNAGDEDLTSNHAQLLELEWTAEVVAREGEPVKQAVITQLQYLSGHLSAIGSAGAQTRLVQILESSEAPAANGTKIVTYKAAVPLAWPKWSRAPETYDLTLPRDASALWRFNSKYDGKCGKSQYGQDRFWYDYDPSAPTCTFDEADVVRATALVRPHPRVTQDKYPEYDKVWADDALDVLMVNGVIANDDPSDESYREVDAIFAELERTLRSPQRTESPRTSSIRRDIVLSGKLDVGGRERDVRVRALNVYEVETSGRDFDAVYGPASAKADVIVYSGHSGLGRHIKSLLARTEVEKDRYQVLYLYGCNTLEYVSTDIYERKTETNGAEADPTGTKFFDVISTARPAYGDNGRSTLAVVKAMFGSKQSYNDLLARDFSSSHLTVVFGEEDNTFTP